MQEQLPRDVRAMQARLYSMRALACVPASMPSATLVHPCTSHGEILFLAPPKKSTQEKGGPKACPHFDYKAATLPCPCASRKNRRLLNSQFRS